MLFLTENFFLMKVVRIWVSSIVRRERYSGFISEPLNISRSSRWRFLNRVIFLFEIASSWCASSSFFLKIFSTCNCKEGSFVKKGNTGFNTEIFLLVEPSEIVDFL